MYKPSFIQIYTFIISLVKFINFKNNRKNLYKGNNIQVSYNIIYHVQHVNVCSNCYSLHTYGHIFDKNMNGHNHVFYDTKDYDDARN